MPALLVTGHSSPVPEDTRGSLTRGGVTSGASAPATRHSPARSPRPSSSPLPAALSEVLTRLALWPLLGGQESTSPGLPMPSTDTCCKNLPRGQGLDPPPTEVLALWRPPDAENL